MLEVIKRNGERVPFSEEKIEKAIAKAMSETRDGIDEKLCKSVAKDMKSFVEKRKELVTVEEIQDQVELKLMMSPRKDVAKQYIIYRNERYKARDIRIEDNSRLLTDDFITKYKHAPSPMNSLGNFVYYRTYSRWLPEERRREYWWETVRRAVEYNCSLANASRKEAEELFDNIFHLKQFLSGRTFWVGGTPIAKEHPMSNFNCAYSTIDSISSFKDLFYLLMVGSGVGLRVLKEDIDGLPKFRKNYNLIHESYEGIEKNLRNDNTSLNFVDNDTARITVGDSKEGWVQALDLFLKILTTNDYRNIKTIIMNYDNVRPKGEKLKRFGGTASGHESLKIMISKVDKVLSKAAARDSDAKIKLRPIDCLDIVNIIGENVVVGGVRRTAEIVLIDSNDKECIEAKSKLYHQEGGQWVTNKELLHRQMSNNSIYYKEKPSREQLKWQIEQMRYSGEPGFVNSEAASKRRDNFSGVNPCLRGDMKLLTVDGYKTFEELDGKEVQIINENGDISNSKVWLTGIKPTYEIKFNNRSSIFATDDHTFKTIDGRRVPTLELKGERLMPYTDKDNTNTEESETVVVDVVATGKEEKVYDFSEPLTHWGVVEGIITHNCGEILLDSRGMCNLTTVNVFGFVDGGKLDREGLLRAQELSARAGYRMTQVEFEINEWNKIHKRDALVGTSLTGWQDMVNATNMTKKEEKKLLEDMRRVANEACEDYAKALMSNPPVLVTTVKPEGCLGEEHVRVFEQGVLLIDELDSDILKADEGFRDLDDEFTSKNDKVTKTYKNKKKKLVSVALKNGRVLRVTPTHPMSVSDEWVKSKNLKVGDQLDYELGTYKNEVAYTTKGEKPCTITDGIAYVLGAIALNSEVRRSKKIRITSPNEKSLEKIKKILLDEFKLKNSVEVSDDELTVSSESFLKWMMCNADIENETTVIPKAVRMSSYKHILSYIAGMADNAGCYHNEALIIDSKQESFLRHVQEVAEAVGISFGLTKNKDTFRLCLSRYYSLEDSIEYINKMSVETDENPIKYEAPKASCINPYRIVSVDQVDADFTYDIEVENTHWYYQGALKSHNTLSQLPGVSSGIHYSHSPFFIRRVRINADDPLVKVCEELGYSIKPEVGQDWETCNTKVIEFPVKAPKGKTKYDISAIEQLENYKMFMEHYVDHNASITVHVRDDEWEAVEEWVWNNWDDVVALSFLSLDDSFYELMPYESITEKEYNKMASELPTFIPSLLNKYEKEELQLDVGNDGCESGICPIR